MPFAAAGDLTIRYELEGPKGAPVVVLASPLGADLTLWEPQREPLARRFRVLRYDARGHGESTVTPGPYRIERLAGDVVALLEALALDRVHFCGLSIGGLVGQWLGARAPRRLHSLTLCNTASRVGTVEGWEARIATVRLEGLRGLIPLQMERWFTPPFRARHPEAVARAAAMLEKAPVEGYLASCAALRDADLSRDVAGIEVRTLVMAGGSDPATTPAEGRALAAAISGARYVELPAAHISNVEAAEAFTDELTRHVSA